MDFDIPTRWMSMVVREPTQRLTSDGDIIDNPICRYKGQDVELVYDSNNGECDIKEDLINLNAGDRIMVKGIMRVEPVDIKGMLALRSSLAVEDIDEDEDVSEQAEESGSEYGSGHDDELGTEEYHRYHASNIDKHNISHHPDRPFHNEPYQSMSITDNRIIAQHPGKSRPNDSYGNNNFNTNNPNFDRAGNDDPYRNNFKTNNHNFARAGHDDPYHNNFNVNTDNPTVARAGRDDSYQSTSDTLICSTAYHSYRSVHVDTVHEMGVDHRKRPFKRRCTPYPKTNSKQHHRGMSTPRFGANSVIGHREIVYYQPGHEKVLGSAKNQPLVSRQRPALMVPIEDDEEEYQCHPIRNTLGTRTARSPSMMPNKQERRNEVHVHDTPATRMFRSPSLTSIKQEEDEGQYILDHPSMYVKEEFAQDVHYYSPHGPAQGEQQADGPSPMVNGNRSRQREPLYYDNIILPMMPKRTMVTIPPKSLPLMKPLLPMSPTPLKSPTPPRSLMSPLPSMWSMWSMPTLPPRSRFSHPIWVHPFTHQCSDGSLREELCWDS